MDGGCQGQPSLQSQSFGSSIASRYGYYSAYDGMAFAVFCSIRAAMPFLPYLYLLPLIILLVSELSVLCMKFCIAERNEGVDGESPQRCKARFERHQRTAERAV